MFAGVEGKRGVRGVQREKRKKGGQDRERPEIVVNSEQKRGRGKPNGIPLAAATENGHK